MKFRVFNDIHLDFGNFTIKPLPRDKDTTLFVVGDIATAGTIGVAATWLNEQAKNFKYVVAVLGNHDYWGATDWKIQPNKLQQMCTVNVYILEKQIITLDGVKIGGATLWTDLDNDPIKELQLKSVTNDLLYTKNFTANDWVKEFTWTKEWIRTNPVDILLTHYVPMKLFTPPMFKNDYANFAFNCDVAIELFNEGAEMPKFWLFGHTHYTYDEVVNNTHYICNPVGYGRNYENTKYKEVEVYTYGG